MASANSEAVRDREGGFVSGNPSFGWYVRKDDRYGVITEPLSAEEGRFRLEGLFLAQ